MGRKLLIGPKDIIDETGLDTTTTGAATYCENVDLVSYDIIWSNGNTPVATVVFEYSNDKTEWRDLVFSGTISISGASGVHRVDIEPNFVYVRPKVTFSSGDTDLLIEVKGTTKGA